jgi:hypothetical protein
MLSPIHAIFIGAGPLSAKAEGRLAKRPISSVRMKMFFFISRLSPK